MICLASMGSVTALGAAAGQALKAVLWGKHDRYALGTDTRQLLLDYFIARGRGVTDLPFDLDTSDESAWEAEWRAYGAAASVSDVAELLIMIRWLRARSGPRGGAGRMMNAAAAVASLESHGVVLTPTVAAALERDMSASAAGDETTQCVNPHVAFRLLTNEAPTELQAAWWWEQHAALTSLHGGVGVNIPGQEEYRKLHKPSNSRVQRMTLETALKRESDFALWFSAAQRELEVVGFPKAATRLVTLVTSARADAEGLWEPTKAYLEFYFFTEYRGLGLPSTSGVRSQAAATAALVKTSVASAVAGAKQGLHSVATSVASSSMSSTMSGFVPAVQSGSTVTADLASLRSGALSDPGGSSVGPSASAVGVDLKQLVGALVPELVPALRDVLRGDIGTAGGNPKGGDLAKKRCPFCRRDNCLMLDDPTKLCRSASQALKLHKASEEADTKADKKD